MAEGEDLAAQNTALPLTQRMTYRLSRVQSKLNAWATKILRERADLTLMQWRVLVLLDTLGESTIGDMVRATEFDKGLLSRTVKTLHERGAVNMVTSQTDQRSHSITMTPSGREIFEQAAPAMLARQKALIAKFTQSEIEMIYRVFEQLEEVVDTYGDGKGDA